MYNPFDEEILEQFVSILNNDISRHNRQVRIIYVNPKHEAVLLRNGFKLEKEFYYRTKIFVNEAINAS